MLRLPGHLVLSVASDPITAFLAKDCGTVSGWGLATTLAMLIVVGAFREWWAPASQIRRLEAQLERIELASDKLTEANLELRKQNTMLIQANRITEHFFAETTPKRGETEE